MNRALLVGINAYPGQPLAGCLNDVEDVAKYLETVHGFSSESVELLCDSRATKAAIIDALRNLVDHSVAGDQLLFHYSGHGAQIESDQATEPDGLDEVLCPVDFNWTRAHALVDDEIGAILASVPTGVTMTMVIDACHSGDTERPWGRRFMVPPPDIKRKLARRRSVRRLLPRSATEQFALVAACRSDETAADASFDDRPNGAFTYFFLKQLLANGSSSLREVVDATGRKLGSYHMHPSVVGPAPIVDSKFLGDSQVTNQSGDMDADDAWRAVLEEMSRLAKHDREFRALLESHGGVFGGQPEEVFRLTKSLQRSPKARGGTVARTFWWGFHIEISHEDLAAFIPGANAINAIAAAIGPVTGPAAPFVEAAALFVAAGLQGIQALDAGAGIYLSMTWFAPGVFVPTTVPVRNAGRLARSGNGVDRPFRRSFAMEA